jgi:hypothetical protein
MLAAGWIGHEHEPRHSRLEHDGVCRVEPQHDTFADAVDRVDRPPNGAAAKAVDPRRDGDRPAATRHALDGTNAAADDTQHATPHRFHFRELGHEDTNNGTFWTGRLSDQSVGVVALDSEAWAVENQRQEFFQ